MLVHGGYRFKLTLTLLFNNYDYLDLLDIVESFVNSPYNTKIGWIETKKLKFIEFEFLLNKIRERVKLENEQDDEVIHAKENQNMVPLQNLMG